ncbi:helix-turn-helix transcriptional regulator [Azospirillum oryzae]|nr:hypothetical protein [Azospirillum oryzae]
MRDLPPEAPAAFGELLELSRVLGGETMLFMPDDRIGFVSDNVRSRYPFFGFPDGATFPDLYWSIVHTGMSTAESLVVPPADYLAMIVNSRRANPVLDFRKRYQVEGSAVDLQCHHRALPDGWTAQVRVDVAQLRVRGWVAGTAPRSVFEMLNTVHETERFEALLNRLSLGVAIVGRDRSVRWANAAARFALLGGLGCTVQDGRLVALDAAADIRLGELVQAAADHGRGGFLGMPSASNPTMVSVGAGLSVGDAVILIPPPAPVEAVVRDALGTLGLSPGQCDVALSIVTAGGPAEAAASTGRAYATVRKQLVRIYAVLGLSFGVTSQRALAHLIGQVASIAGARPQQMRMLGYEDC